MHDVIDRLKYQVRSHLKRPSYDSDTMRLWDRSLDFLTDPRFLRAYERGMNSGHRIGRPEGSTRDIGIQFRVYMECWAAEHGTHLEGDFVCCGVNTGINPLAICEYVDFNTTGKAYWLFDTYEGIPADQLSEAERAADRLDDNVMYRADTHAIAKRNFAPFPKAHLVKGKVPDTLDTVTIDKVAYLAIDMNIAYPERKAIEHFWPKLSPGAFVILDDYGFAPYIEQKQSMDEFARSVGVAVCTLPTGQGMMVKPG